MWATDPCSRLAHSPITLFRRKIILLAPTCLKMSSALMPAFHFMLIKSWQGAWILTGPETRGVHKRLIPPANLFCSGCSLLLFTQETIAIIPSTLRLLWPTKTILNATEQISPTSGHRIYLATQGSFSRSDHLQADSEMIRSSICKDHSCQLFHHDLLIHILYIYIYFPRNKFMSV